MGTMAHAASAPPSSRLRQEVKERLVEGHRILVAHEVRGLGNDHQATAGNALHDHLIDQRKVSRRLFPAHDEGRGLHTTQRSAGDRERPRRRKLERDRPRVVQDHLAERLRLHVEGPSALVVRQFKEQLGGLYRLPGLCRRANRLERFPPLVAYGLDLWEVSQHLVNGGFKHRQAAYEVGILQCHQGDEVTTRGEPHEMHRSCIQLANEGHQISDMGGD
jgi:hypothetical protein